ncbi:MAG: hypothetical protein AcusKO_29670 [Acuticoccus sp.]
MRTIIAAASPTGMPVSTPETPRTGERIPRSVGANCTVRTTSAPVKTIAADLRQQIEDLLQREGQEIT